MKYIIAISGNIGAGKSTAAQYFVNRKGGKIFPFAKPLKDVALSMGWNGLKDPKGRKLLQVLGTECGRECISENIWTDKWMEAIEGDIVIVDDLRFQNEYDCLNKVIGYKVVHIHLTRGEPKRFFHKSEQGFSTYRPVNKFENNGTLGQLETFLGGLL